LPISNKKVFIVIESSAQPYLQNIHNLIYTESDGSFSFYTHYLPNNIFPLQVAAYTYDSNFKREGYLITFNQNNTACSHVDIHISTAAFNYPTHPIQLESGNCDCPAYLKANLNDSLKRNHLKEEFRWAINNKVVSTEQNYSTLLMQPNNSIEATIIFIDSITNIKYDSIQLQYSANLPASDFHVLAGTVFSGNFPTTSGEAILYGRCGNNYFNVDTCFYTQYGYYYFQSVPNCNYTIRINESDNSMSYNSIPTYLGSKIRWEEASFIKPAENCYNANITLQSQITNTGICEISGLVNNPDLSDYDILLFTENMMPFSYRKSGNDGYFQFSALPYGNYFLVSEKYGCPSVSQYVTLSESNPTAFVSLNVNTSINEQNSYSVSVFPNPADDFIYFSPATTGEINIFSLDGKIVLTKEIKDNKVDISELNSGIYFAKFVINGQPAVARFMKN